MQLYEFQSIELGDCIFKINWVILSAKSNKDMLLTLLRSTRPIVVNSGFFIILSLDSFMKVSLPNYYILKVYSITVSIIKHVALGNQTFIYSI